MYVIIRIVLTVTDKALYNVRYAVDTKCSTQIAIAVTRWNTNQRTTTTKIINLR